jgi:hypothetical protein
VWSGVEHGRFEFIGRFALLAQWNKAGSEESPKIHNGREW